MPVIGRGASAPFHIPARPLWRSSLVLLSRSSQPSAQAPTLTSIRYASHAAQGRANGPKNGPGKRLGAKKIGGELVVPGNIIYRQRGTKWFPGENVGIGRDHTLFAREKGYVRYYQDPATPKRRYIGIVFEKHQTLPTPLNAPRRRRLGMVAIPRRSEPGEEGHVEAEASENTVATIGGPLGGRRVIRPGDVVGKKRDGTPLRMRSDYSFRESNIEIGRIADKAGRKVANFEKGDRWLAWRKANARKARNQDTRALAGASKKGKKAGKAKPKAKAKGSR